MGGEGYTATMDDQTTLSYCTEPILTYSGVYLYEIDYDEEMELLGLEDISCRTTADATLEKSSGYKGGVASLPF
jgi:hypothetical protein